MKEENGELKKQLKMSEFIKKKYEILKNENILYKEQVTVLNEENETLRMQLNELQTKLDKMKANEKKLSNGYHQKEKNEKIENVMDENDESEDNAEEEVQKDTGLNALTLSELKSFLLCVTKKMAMLRMRRWMLR